MSDQSNISPLISAVDEDVYYTIESEQRAEIKVKSSTFIGTAIPVFTKANALGSLERIKADFFDATHNCYAYKLGSKGLEFRAADDGEPSGSAGKPILFMLQKYGVSDILLVVTRYFGNTKLGVGGLARAYADSAEAVLTLCTRKPVYNTIVVKIFSTYEDSAVVRQIISQKAISFEQDFGDSVEFRAQIPERHVTIFEREVIEQTSGRAGIVVLGK